LEGFLYNTIGKLMGIKPSAKDPEICNKCTEEGVLENETPSAPEVTATPVTPEPSQPEAIVEPEAEVKEEEPKNNL